MTDKYWVYRPLLDLLGTSEGTDFRVGSRVAARGYNETLAYGALTGGDVELVKMTLTQIDALQTKMLSHKANRWNSSALGRYQIVRTTLRSIRQTLNLDGNLLFDAAMQDQMGCYLLGVRGIDKWLAGRLSTETLMDNMAKEWASLPNSKGVGHYSGQKASVTVGQVKAALEAVRLRHLGQQPMPPAVKEDLSDAMTEVESSVKKETGLWGWITTALGGIGALGSWLADKDNSTILTFAGVAVGGILIITFLGPRLAKSLRAIREELL